MALLSETLSFWLTAVAMTAVALAFVLPTLLSRRRPGPGPSRRDTNLALWREAVVDLARDSERGLLPTSELEEARRELVDRAAADGVGEPEAAPDAQPADRAPFAAALVAIALPAISFGLYAVLGEPGVIDGQLEQHLAARPADGRGWMLLARQEFERERYAESADAFERAVTASPKVARDPVVWCQYADAAGMAQGGRLAGKPANLIATAMAFSPPPACALEMAGSLAYERRDYARAVRHWRELAATMGERDPARSELDAAIARAAKLAARQSTPLALRN